MMTIQIVTLPDRTIYLVLEGQKGPMLFEFDAHSGDYNPIQEPNIGSWSRDDIQLEQRTIL